MTRYALIDINSGFVWGVTDAANPEDACQSIDYDLGVRGRFYSVHGPNSRMERSGQDGYIVHEVPAGFDVDDGQDRDEIAATEAFPRTAIVLIRDDAE